jgi:nucleoside-diphosphate-sugar epimerase
MSRKRILITGGAGAIGSNLAQTLLERGNEVGVIDDLSSGYRDLVPDGVRFVEGSITDDKPLAAAFDPVPDFVIHAAALFANQNSVEHPQADLLVNGLGSIKVLERAVEARVQKVVFCSSSCVYGGKEVMRESDTDLAPDTPYAISKWLGERYVCYWANQHKLNAASVRLFNVYGPGERPGRYRNVIPNFFALALRKEPLVITGTGEETRDFTFVNDAVDGIIGVLAAPTAPGETVNIGSGQPTRIIDLATRINELAGNSSNIRFAPRRSWDHVPHRNCDNTRARQLFGFAPSTTLDQGLEMTLAWLKSDADSVAAATAVGVST